MTKHKELYRDIRKHVEHHC